MPRNRSRRELVAKTKVECERRQDFEVVLRIPRVLPEALVGGAVDKMSARTGNHIPQQEAWIANRLHGKSVGGIAAPVIANAVEGRHGFIECECARRIVAAG